MDPVSVIGLASSVVGIVEVATRSISALRALQQRWKAADLTISLLISQLTTLKAALSQIKEWISTSLNAAQHYQLVMDLGASLDSCESLLLFIDGQLSHLDWNDRNALSFESRIKAVLQDNTVRECATHLANQSTALSLLLAALNCRSMSEQGALMQAKGNRRILDQVKDDSSSLFCVRDSASFCTSLTSATERSNLLDISFGFDEELTATKVYHRQWRPLIREALRRGKKAKEGSANCQKVHSNGLTPIISFPIQKNPRVVDVRILAVGQSDTQACKLSKIMSIMCEEHYDPELRRGHILQVILDTTNATLDKMAELSLPMENLGAEIRPQVTLRLQTPINSAGISEELGNALIALWDNPGVRSCYLDNIKRTAHPSATYFLDSITRIYSVGYEPSFEDAAMSLVIRSRHSDCLALPVTMSSRRYNVLRWNPRGASLRFPLEISSEMPPEASLKTMADECEDLDAIIFMVDLATYNTHPNDGSFADEWDNNLQRFRRFCKLPWYTEKDVILLFFNIDKLSMKPLIVHASSHRHDNSHARTVDDIVKSFVSLNMDESREIHVIFADNDDKAKNLESLDGAVKLILSRKANSARDS